jgi:hypothetical protein
MPDFFHAAAVTAALPGVKQAVDWTLGMSCVQSLGYVTAQRHS